MDKNKTWSYVDGVWNESVIPTLEQYIRIPNQSPSFDPEWKTNGPLEKAANLMIEWVHQQHVPGLELELLKFPERTPLIFITIPGTNNVQETVLLYGHLDKQPPMTDSWESGLGPYNPVIRNGKLYGRGGSDDGYAIFAAISSLKAIQAQGVPHARCVIVIEACEESGSPDLPIYMEHLKSRIGVPSLIICLDSGCGNYEQFWITTSLRGLLVGELKVKILNEAVHSGSASGIVPSSFRIIRQLLSRLEDENTGEIKPREFYGDIPQSRAHQAKACATALGHTVYSEFPFVEGAKPVQSDITELILNRTWKPALSITGAEGLPTVKSGGNVLRTQTSLKVSLRLPPSVNATPASQFLKELLEKNPPYGAQVSYEPEKAGTGWNAPDLSKWLEESLERSSGTFYGKPTNFVGEGGSIPFMGMLGKSYPEAQFVVTGVLGPQSNAHGPNEFLHIDMAKKVTCCVAHILSDHYIAKVKKDNNS